ncbi:MULTISPECIES: TrmH family RNA methyltransferase [unclassified Treponema]|uniref:TrmH family RNA methyltransferase n=1 Tax=unclassified Treponema TaxID=2638727 RepID=UPI001B2630EC|nr:MULTISPECIES: TrmH family RNA methyltransferase [unclassified Treponema]MBO6217968.1 TrmH family RNA methyltransferase [Treponema sp.]MBQ8679472.1 TrmH family RNA methyltransferase [Treponema sp.]
MIEPHKLNQLQPGQKRRKLALTFGALERDVDGIPEKGNEYNFKSMPRADYIKKLIEIVIQDPELPQASKNQLEEVLQSSSFDEKRACNLARNNLLAIIGTFPAEWDLIIAPHASPLDEKGLVKQRDFFHGVYVYAEDIRSPFNCGSIFRTAEAMGAEKVLISPMCIDPNHPKALRSGMGCIETLGFERKSLDELEEFAKENDLPIFVLETGGKPIEEFKFPKKGICIIGSEELGVSPQALSKATYGRVTIPMKGLKASLNVGVAYGILMQAWVNQL